MNKTLKNRKDEKTVAGITVALNPLLYFKTGVLTLKITLDGFQFISF